MTIKTRSTEENKAETSNNSVDKALTRSRKATADQVAQVQKAEVVDATIVKEQRVELPGLDQAVTGRGVFVVRTLESAVSVEAGFLVEDGNVLRLPAVYPNRQYALDQIDELKTLINRHFDEIEKSVGVVDASV